MENTSEDPNAPGALMLPPGEIERWVRDFHDERARSGGWPTIYVRKRDASNIALLLADEEETVSGFDAVGLGAAPRGHQNSRRPPQQRFPRAGDKVVKKEGTGPGARGYQGIVYAITFARELRRRGVTCSQRELYYNYKGDGESPWRSQAECNESIADAAAIFGRPRFALGFTTAPRGMVAGLVSWRGAGQRDWTSARGTARHVDHGWLTDGARQLRSEARCVVVVEKEGVFQRLVEDNFYDDAYPCVLVTAMGVPDLATRAFVHRLRATLGLPVYGLVDWNSWGVGVLLTYKLGSARLGVESHRYTVDVAWLGLRASQIDRFDVPDVCMQPLTARDKKRGEGIMAHPWVAGRRDWLDEIQAQLDKDFKCELEAMALAPPRERGRGKLSFQNLSHFVEEAIVARDWLE